MTTASNETAMAADDAQSAVEARNGGALAKPPTTHIRAKQGRIVKIFRRRWSNVCTLSDMAAKPRNYQVAILENSLADEAMRLYDGFQFTTPQEHRTTTEMLSAFDEFGIAYRGR